MQLLKSDDLIIYPTTSNSNLDYTNEPDLLNDDLSRSSHILDNNETSNYPIINLNSSNSSSLNGNNKLNHDVNNNNNNNNKTSSPVKFETHFPNIKEDET